MLVFAVPVANAITIYADSSEAARISEMGWTSTCAGPIMNNLNFNLSDIPVPQTLPDPERGETLSQAICCDSFYRSVAAAEPSGLFADPQVNMLHVHAHMHTLSHADTYTNALTHVRAHIHITLNSWIRKKLSGQSLFKDSDVRWLNHLL